MIYALYTALLEHFYGRLSYIFYFILFSCPVTVSDRENTENIYFPAL